KKYNEGKMPSIPNKKRKTVDNNKNNIQVKGKTISIPSSITIKDISTKMGVRSSEIIKKLMSMGVMANINQEIDSETAVIVGEEFNVEVKVKQEKDNESLLLQEIEDNPSELQSRPCVVTVIGHVDHGKTSLLDAVRETKVTASESGGITQHIGAYQVERNGKKITFLDTPGHEAFTAMRARGTQVTDIAILVIGADDGVMPQTVEAINHAKAAGVSIIVAINKIDKANADQDKVKRELTEYELIPEEWGGDTICVPVSATMHEGLDDLLEMILLVSEMQELKANPNCYSRGIVIESKLDKGRGAVATVLIKKGTLKVGDALVAGTSHGKVRAMMDYRRERVDSAGPSFPVQVLGFSEVPDAGDKFFALEDEKKARDICEKRKDRKREEELKVPAPKVSLDDVFNQIKEGQVKELSLIIKADVQGSVEALKQSLEKLSTDEVKVNIIHIGVGAITETDIMLASASNAIVIGFNVRPDANARKAAELEKIDVRTYRVIYDVIENIKSAMTGLLDPEYKEVILGHAQVRKTFKVSKLGTIAGCYVTDGKLVRDSGARLIRDGVVVYEGKMDSLKRYKDDTKEVVENYECGLTLEKFNDINEDDIIEAFTTEAVKRELT
ncbi:MAG: translation initiation factor IF-2, partial [Clostridiales bacterium]|nr:translation initiation factor IF-2 [Clostridiales bacterium]